MTASDVIRTAAPLPLADLAVRCGRGGIVLLEVILASTLLFMGVLIILAGLNSSLQVAQRVELEAQAADMAVTLFSEVQMGQVPLVTSGPNDYEEEALADWTWRITVQAIANTTVTQIDLPPSQQVEIAIRHKNTGYSFVLSEVMTEEAPAAQEVEQPAENPPASVQEPPAYGTEMPEDGEQTGGTVGRGRSGGRNRSGGSQVPQQPGEQPE